MDEPEPEPERVFVDAIKAELLRIPVSAWHIASQRSAAARLAGNVGLADVYLRIANELRDEGYGPDLETGEPGPKTKAHYVTGVLGD